MDTQELIERSREFLIKVEQTLQDVREFKRNSPLFNKKVRTYIRYEIEQRKYSPDIIVGIYLGEDGKEKKHPYLFLTSDEQIEQILNFLNSTRFLVKNSV